MNRLAVEEWKALAPAERARQCRLLGEQALALSNGVTGKLKENYLTMAEGWLKLAAEIERETK